MTDQPTSDTMSAQDAWEAPGIEDRPREQDALVVNVGGYEGPLDLLLALARTQKVDIAGISMLNLAEQYLSFITEAQRLKLELAADYLVMAAWLAFLKSRLLLPRDKPVGDEPNADELAQQLAFRLMRLDAMRNAAAHLMARWRLGRDVFAHGSPEGFATIRERQYTAQIYDLLQAYAQSRNRSVRRVHVVKARTVWSIKDARVRLEQLIGQDAGRWVQLDAFLERYLPSPDAVSTVLAASFGAALEMTREGAIELRQEAPFAPIYVRKRGGSSDWERLA